MDYSDYSIAKVNSFLGLKSIDPFVPFDLFLEKNHTHLLELLESKRLLVFDADGNEVDISLVEQHIIKYHEEMNTEVNLDLKNIMDPKFYPKKVQKIIEKIEQIEVEEKDSISHRDNLIKTLNECDEGYKSDIQKGIDITNQKIKKMYTRRKSLLFSINKQLKL